MPDDDEHSRLTIAAVRKLRKAIGETQQSMAARLGVAMATMVRYETTRAPKGAVLNQLKQLADAHGLPELAKVFEARMRAQMGLDTAPGEGPEFYSIVLTKPEEIAPVRALVESLRNPAYSKTASAAVRALAPVIQYFKKVQEEMRYQARLSEAMLGAFRAGKTDREIAAFFDVTVKQVLDWKRVNGLEGETK